MQFSEGQFTLGARDLAGCEFRLVKDVSGQQTLRSDYRTVVDSPSVLRRKEAAAQFRVSVYEFLLTIYPQLVTIRGTYSERVEATLAAIRNDAEYIWGATFPDDTVAHRNGFTELLFRAPDHSGYIPIIVVNHRVTEKKTFTAETDAIDTQKLEQALENTGLTSSPLWTWQPMKDPYRKLRSNNRDMLRISHLTRMLLRLGAAAKKPVAGIIGIDLDCIVVQDMSNLEMYDERFLRRVEVVTGIVESKPSRVRECQSCRWWSECELQLKTADDVSLFVSGNYPKQLAELGIFTGADLLNYQGGQPDSWTGAPFGEVKAMAKAKKLGISLIRRHARVEVQRADIEVDVDMESFGEEGAYLWGTLLTDNTNSTAPVEYRPFVTWISLPTVDEARSFAEFWGWLMKQRYAAKAVGKTFAAYCYSQAAENHWLFGSARRFIGLPGIPTETEVREFVESSEWVDIFEAVGKNFLCPEGKGLKKIAPVAGFNWRDDEASGEASMDWYQLAVGKNNGPLDLSQRKRLLEYNEDDVWATKVVREWMSAEAVETVIHLDSLITS